MISYGISIQGKSHIEHDVPCQDYNKIKKLNDRWHLGIVADGVGSAIHADVGSRMASESLSEYCRKKIELEMTDQQLEDSLRLGFEYAMDKITKHAKKEEKSIDYYDTTLSAVLYNGEKVIFGHAGDGGILVRQCNGTTKPITKRQKGDDGSSVRPLRAGKSSWEFGIYDEDVVAVLLATDGMLDGVFQPVLVNLPPDIASLARGDFPKDNVYITASEFFMNPNGVYLNKKIVNGGRFMEKYVMGDLGEKEQKAFLNCMQLNYMKLLGRNNAVQICRKILKYHYAVNALNNVTDDKSVVCLMNEKAKVIPQDIVYYYEPNWGWRQEKYHALLYERAIPPVPEDDPMYMDNVSSKKEKIKDKKVLNFEKESGKKSSAIKEERIECRLEEKKGIRKKVMILCSILCVLLIGGIAVGIITAKNGKGDAEKPTAFIQDTEKPTSISKATTESNVTESGLTESEEEEVAVRSKKFVELLAEIDLTEQRDSGDLRILRIQLKSMKDKLEPYTKMDEAYKWQREGFHITDTEDSMASGSMDVKGTSRPMREDSLSALRDQKMKKIVGCILFINADYELNAFIKDFQKIWERLSESEKDTVRRNLKHLLNVNN